MKNRFTKPFQTLNGKDLIIRIELNHEQERGMNGKSFHKIEAFELKDLESNKQPISSVHIDSSENLEDKIMELEESLRTYGVVKKPKEEELLLSLGFEKHKAQSDL